MDKENSWDQNNHPKESTFHGKKALTEPTTHQNLHSASP